MKTTTEVAQELATILEQAMKDHPQDLAAITTVTLVGRDRGILFYPVPGEDEPKDGINQGHGFHLILNNAFADYTLDFLEEVLNLLFPGTIQTLRTPKFVASEWKVPSDLFYKGVYTYLP